MAHNVSPRWTSYRPTRAHDGAFGARATDDGSGIVGIAVPVSALVEPRSPLLLPEVLPEDAACGQPVSGDIATSPLADGPNGSEDRGAGGGGADELGRSITGLGATAGGSTCSLGAGCESVSSFIGAGGGAALATGGGVEALDGALVVGALTAGVRPAIK